MVHMVSASRYQRLLADLPSAERQEETENTRKSRGAHKWQATGKHWLTLHSLRVQD